MTSRLDKPSRHAVGFREIKEGDKFVVVWLDQIGGDVAEGRDANLFATLKQAKARSRKLQKQAEQQQPRVVWVESKNAYWLKVKIDGQTKRVSLGEKDYDIALQKVPRKMIEMGWTESIETTVTLGKAVERFIAARTDAPSLRSLMSVCRHLLSFFTYHKPVKSFLDIDYRQYFEHRRALVKTGTLVNEMSVLRAIINQCKRERLIAPGDMPPLPQQIAHEEIDRLVLSKQDFDMILALAETMPSGSAQTGRLSDLEIYLHMVRRSGGRISFYRDLRWSRVDFERRTINFAVVGKAQSKKRRPEIAIADDLFPILQRAYAERDGSEYVMWQRILVGSMFKTLRKHMANSDNDRLRDLAPVIHSHAFRRSFTTWCVAEGVSPWKIGKITGNSTAVIEKFYAVYQPDHSLDVVNKI